MNEYEIRTMFFKGLGQNNSNMLVLKQKDSNYKRYIYIKVGEDINEILSALVDYELLANISYTKNIDKQLFDIRQNKELTLKLA